MLSCIFSLVVVKVASVLLSSRLFNLYLAWKRSLSLSHETICFVNASLIFFPNFKEWAA